MDETLHILAVRFRGSFKGIFSNSFITLYFCSDNRLTRRSRLPEKFSERLTCEEKNFECASDVEKNQILR